MSELSWKAQEFRCSKRKDHCRRSSQHGRSREPCDYTVGTRNLAATGRSSLGGGDVTGDGPGGGGRKYMRLKLMTRSQGKVESAGKTHSSLGQTCGRV